jgi:hypothetical protein
MIVHILILPDDFILTNEQAWLSSFLVRSTPLSRKVSLDCSFLIALSVFSNVYLPMDDVRHETMQHCPEGLKCVLKMKSSLRIFYGHYHDLITVTEYVFVTRVKRRMPLVEE